MLPSSKNQSESWKEALEFMGRCPLCGGNYPSASARRLRSVGVADLVHLTCGKCASGFVAMVMVSPAGLSSVGMVTDLNYDDALRLHNTPKISLDEAIAGYEYLKKVGIKILNF